MVVVTGRNGYSYTRYPIKIKNPATHVLSEGIHLDSHLNQSHLVLTGSGAAHFIECNDTTKDVFTVSNVGDVTLKDVVLPTTGRLSTKLTTLTNEQTTQDTLLESHSTEIDDIQDELEAASTTMAGNLNTLVRRGGGLGQNCKASCVISWQR